MGRKRTSNKTSLTLSVDKDLLEKLKDRNINLSALFTQSADTFLKDFEGVWEIAKPKNHLKIFKGIEVKLTAKLLNTNKPVFRFYRTKLDCNSFLAHLNEDFVMMDEIDTLYKPGSLEITMTNDSIMGVECICNEITDRDIPDFTELDWDNAKVLPAALVLVPSEIKGILITNSAKVFVRNYGEVTLSNFETFTKDYLCILINPVINPQT